jgi:hypothetical protein
MKKMKSVSQRVNQVLPVAHQEHLHCQAKFLVEHHFLQVAAHWILALQVAPLLHLHPQAVAAEPLLHLLHPQRNSRINIRVK